MTTWATSTIDVIALTQRPASAPTPIAIATRPNSLARRRRRSLASVASALRGRKLIVAAGRFGVRPQAWADLCAAGDQSQGVASSLRQRHVVAVDHFGAAGGAENMRDVARLAAANAFGVQ